MLFPPITLMACLLPPHLDTFSWTLALPAVYNGRAAVERVLTCRTTDC